MPTAVDLYSGVGGWSLGLRMAGIDVVSSYEWWSKANETNLRNNGHKTECLDIRQLSPSSVPKVDLIVGSPPCTHFSLANRGGKSAREESCTGLPDSSPGSWCSTPPSGECRREGRGA
jgi:DNA (cytosine-5)-methyltransferase 1